MKLLEYLIKLWRLFQRVFSKLKKISSEILFEWNNETI